MMKTLPLLTLSCLFLAACGGDGPRGDDGRTASGEILEGSISDAMIPLDQLKSQAPLAKPEVKPAAGDAGAEAADAPAEAASGDAASAPADPIGDAVSGGE